MNKFNEIVDDHVKQVISDDRKIRHVIEQIMPPECLENVKFLRIENRVLRMTLDNASWLARLRFISPQLIDALKADNITVTKVTWHVAPDKIKVEARAKTVQKRAGSESGARTLQCTAQDMEADDLQRALLKLAEQLGRRSER